MGQKSPKIGFLTQRGELNLVCHVHLLNTLMKTPPQKQLACRICGEIQSYEPLDAGWVAHCCRCGTKLYQRNGDSLHRTAAFALSALLLYIPANIFPILRMNLYGATSENTVWQGCVRLYKDGDSLIAVVVFLASMAIPLLKLLGLFFLAATAQSRWERGKAVRTAVYKFVSVVGRWAMLDVFVLAVLVSLVKLQRLATVLPGSGAIAFVGVVFFTLLASESFDPQLIWNPQEL
jgi:paraquat-inducible protein A